MEPKKDALLPALVLGLLVPFWLLNGAALFLPHQEPGTTIQVSPQSQQTDPNTPERQISILTDGAQTVMELEEYLVGVVLGEMPASFEVEALKAQAVVARTYTLRRVEESPKHEGNAVCTSPDCCQAYTAPEAYLASGGTQDDLDRVSGAVEATAGLVLTYEGKLIEATYFSSSGGRTEDALAVWGSDLPYLQATDSPEDAYADKYTDRVSMSLSDFREALGLAGTGIPRIQSVTYTEGGGVGEMTVGGQVYEGTQLRKLLGLKSTDFTVSFSGDTVTILTRGHGHRVGMSQYGAEAMAVTGSTYDAILLHYYKGVILEEYVDNSGNLG